MLIPPSYHTPLRDRSAVLNNYFSLIQPSYHALPRGAQQPFIVDSAMNTRRLTSTSATMPYHTPPPGGRSPLDAAPTEIQSMIVGFIAPTATRNQTDVRNVLAASRVSRSFYRVARRHLYRSVTLRASISHQTLFLRTLQENPDLRPSIRQLTVQNESNDCSIYSARTRDVPPNFCLVRMPPRERSWWAMFQPRTSIQSRSQNRPLGPDIRSMLEESFVALKSEDRIPLPALDWLRSESLVRTRRGPDLRTMRTRRLEEGPNSIVSTILFCLPHLGTLTLAEPLIPHVAESDNASLALIRDVHLDKVGPNLTEAGALLKRMPNLESLHIRRRPPGQRDLNQDLGAASPAFDPNFTMVDLLEGTANTLTSLSIHLSINPSRFFKMRETGEQPIGSLKFLKNLKHLSITPNTMVQRWGTHVST